MASPSPQDANQLIEKRLFELMGALEREIDADVLSFVGSLLFRADTIIRDAVESRKKKRTKLAVILETTGGYIEVVQRIVDTLRRHYDRVEFIIPNYAFSAGTVFVMSGDAIHMDYFSVLGPIDPQLQRPGGGDFVPALGYLVQYERLIEKSKRGTLTTAEMAFLIQKFDPAELYRYEQQRELSITLLKEWLVKYKFKDWTQTETRKKNVTNKMRTDRAGTIAKALNDTKRWHSHGRGISIEVLRNDLKLKIEDFGENQVLNSKIKDYYRLLIDYIGKLGHGGVLHSKGQFIPLKG